MNVTRWPIVEELTDAARRVVVTIFATSCVTGAAPQPGIVAPAVASKKATVPSGRRR